MVFVEVNRDALDVNSSASVFEIKVGYGVEDGDMFPGEPVKDVIHGGVVGFCFFRGVAQGVEIATKAMGVEDEFDRAAFLIGDLTNDPRFDAQFLEGVDHLAEMALEDFGGVSVGAVAIRDCDFAGAGIGNAIFAPAGNEDDFLDVVFFDEAEDGIVEARDIGSVRESVGIEDGRVGGPDGIVDINFAVVADFLQDGEHHLGVTIAPNEDGKGALFIMRRSE